MGSPTKQNAKRDNASLLMLPLKVAREAAGLSLKDVEERTGINKSNLSLLENGKGNPTLETVRRIAEAIGRRVLITVE